MDNKQATREAVAEALADQSWFRRRKDSLTLAATVALMIAQSNVVDWAAYPSWVSVAVSMVIGVAGLVIVAGTKAGITHSMVERIAAHVPEESHSYVPDPVREALSEATEPYGKHAATA